MMDYTPPPEEPVQVREEESVGMIISPLEILASHNLTTDVTPEPESPERPTYAIHEFSVREAYERMKPPKNKE